MAKIESIWKNPKPRSLSKGKDIDCREHINLRVRKAKIQNAFGFLVCRSYKFYRSDDKFSQEIKKPTKGRLSKGNEKLENSNLDL